MEKDLHLSPLSNYVCNLIYYIYIFFYLFYQILFHRSVYLFSIINTHKLDTQPITMYQILNIGRNNELKHIYR